MKRLIPLLFLVLASGCQTYESADLTRYSVQHGFSVSTESLPPNAVPMGIVSMQEDGFYILGVLPIVTVSLQHCLDRVVAEAQKRGAHGIADVQYEVNPAYMFRFSALASTSSERSGCRSILTTRGPGWKTR